MKIKKRVKDSLFLKVFSLIKKNPRPIAFMLLFDVLFFVTIYYVIKFADNIFKKELSLAYLTILFIAYPFLIILVYSFFKYHILYFLKSLTIKIKFTYQKLKKFYFMNLAIIWLIIGVLLILNFIYESTIKEQYLRLLQQSTIILVGILGYLFLNISHSLFIIESKRVLRRALSILFKNIPSYIQPMLFGIFVIVLYFLILYLINLIPDTNFRLTVITALVYYFIIFINRIYFYLITLKITKKI